MNAGSSARGHLRVACCHFVHDRTDPGGGCDVAPAGVVARTADCSWPVRVARASEGGSGDLVEERFVVDIAGGSRAHHGLEGAEGLHGLGADLEQA